MLESEGEVASPDCLPERALKGGLLADDVPVIGDVVIDLMRLD